MRLGDFGGSSKRLAGILNARGVRAVVVERINRRESFEGFPWNDFAAVSCGLGEQHLPIPTVTNDVFAAVRGIWAYARKYGYQRIGLVLHFGGKPDPYYRMLSAARLEQGEKPAKEAVIEPLVISADLGPERIPEIVREWRVRSAPDVIVGNTLIYEILRESGVRIPEDVAFMCFSILASTPEHISGMRPHLAIVGELAVDLCHMQLQRPQARTHPAGLLHLVEPLWVEGRTIPPKQLLHER